MGAGLVHLDFRQVGLASLLIVINATASILLGLGIGRKILVGSVRTVVQLLLVGYVLEYVFALDSPWAVLGIWVIMAALAAQAGVRRTGYRFPGIYTTGFGVMLVSSALVTLFGIVAVIGVKPWYAPQYVIPLAGMVLGNTLNGVSLGLDRLMKGFDYEQAQIETLLAMGATSWEGARDVIVTAITTGMIPILNAMAVVGLVSLPGMMTGQILAGVAPTIAIRYQIVIMFLIAAGTAVGTVGSVLVGFRLLFDSRHRLLRERLQRQN